MKSAPLEPNHRAPSCRMPAVTEHVRRNAAMGTIIRPANAADARRISDILAGSFQALYSFTFGSLPEHEVAGLLDAFYREEYLSLDHTHVAEVYGRVEGVLILHVEGAVGHGDTLQFWRLLRGRLGTSAGVRAFAGAITANSILFRRIPHGPDLSYVEALAVAEPMRGRGLGKLLMERAITWSDANGRSRIALHVLHSNDTARRLYERMGFVSWPDMMSHAPRLNIFTGRAPAWTSMRMIRPAETLR